MLITKYSILMKLYLFKISFHLKPNKLRFWLWQRANHLCATIWTFRICQMSTLFLTKSLRRLLMPSTPLKRILSLHLTIKIDICTSSVYLKIKINKRYLVFLASKLWDHVRELSVSDWLNKQRRLIP